MVDNDKKSAARLGEELKAIRSMKGMSLAAVSGPGKISAAYLHKLEGGLVKNPSPRVLLRISEVLGCDYDRLMELAGYVARVNPAGRGKATFLEAALRNEELTDEEQRAVIAFITYLKGLRSQG